MQKEKIKSLKRKRKKIKVRSKISGTANIPRCSVYKSLNNISAQLINDEKSETIVSFSSISLKDNKGKKKNEISFLVGEEFGKLCLSKNINEIVFDRNGFLYHGRVKSLADGIRKAGVKF